MFETALADAAIARDASLMRRALAVPAILLAVCSGGCLSGQTGSPDCAYRGSCACDALHGGGTLLRVHAERHEDGKLEAVVDEVFANVNVSDRIVVGDRVGGSLLVERPCAPGAAPSVLSGQLFVLYSPNFWGGYANCPALRSCFTTECGKLPEPAFTDCLNACDASTATTCADHRRDALLDGVFSWAIPWSDPLVFGDTIELPRSELAVLESPERCLQRFPAPPPLPCRDTVMSGCSAAASLHEEQGAGHWLYPLGLLALACALRRRSSMV